MLGSKDLDDKQSVTLSLRGTYSVIPLATRESMSTRKVFSRTRAMAQQLRTQIVLTGDPNVQFPVTTIGSSQWSETLAPGDLIHLASMTPSPILTYTQTNRHTHKINL